MGITKFINRSKRNLEEVLSYVASNDRVKSRNGNSPVFMGGIADNPNDAYSRMEIVKRLWNKTGGRTYIHFVFSPKDGDAESMEMFSKRIIKQFNNFACFYGVHQNTKHVHAHYILNSVGFDGKKFTQSKQDLKSLKNKMDSIWYDVTAYEDMDFGSSWKEYDDTYEYNEMWDYPEDTDPEERHIYLYDSTGYVDTSYRPHIDDDYIPTIYRNINGTYYPVQPVITDGKMPMVIKVHPETDIKPMVTFVDEDGYLTLGT